LLEENSKIYFVNLLCVLVPWWLTLILVISQEKNKAAHLLNLRAGCSAIGL